MKIHLAHSPKAKKAIQSSIETIHRYPDVSGYDLRKKLAKKFNVKLNNVVISAGSEGIMSHNCEVHFYLMMMNYLVLKTHLLVIKFWHKPLVGRPNGHQ